MSFPGDEPSLTGFRTRIRQPGRRGGRRALIVVGLLIAVALIQFYFPQLLYHPIAFYPGPPGTTIYVDPAKGWSLQFPSSWDAEPFSEGRSLGRPVVERHGVLLSNIGHDGGASWPPWFETSAFPSTLVAVQVGFGAGRHFTVYCLHDTPLPLTLRGAELRHDPVRDTSGVPVRQLTKRFSVSGLPYYAVTVWIGSQASKDDIAAMENIVGSITYKVTGNAEFGHEDCMNI